MPPELAEVYFDFDWDNRAVWSVLAPSEAMERGVLDWHLDQPFWSTRPPEPLFDLVPRLVLDDPGVHPVHAARIRNADLRHPIDVMEHRGRLCILDGIHRLARHALERRDPIPVRRIPRQAIPLICREPASGR